MWEVILSKKAQEDLKKLQSIGLIELKNVGAIHELPLHFFVVLN